MFGSIRILPRSDVELLHSRPHRQRRSMNRREPQLAVAIEPLEGRTLLSAPVNFAACQVVGNAGGDLTATDFNGDGRIDLASANPSDGTISVLLNNGDGTFAPKVDYFVGPKPRQAAAADLNGDGKIDLAVAYGNSGSGQNGVRVLLNNGDGTFAPGAGFGLVGAPTSLTAADFNADGKADLAVGIGTGAEVFLNTGNGTFSPRSDYPAGLLFPSVAAADVNGDGKIDLVIGGSATDGSNTTVRVLRNNGDGTFALDAAYATLSPADAATRHDVHVISADFDGDGRIDLAVAASASSSSNPGHTDLAILLNQGDGTFASKAAYTWPGAVHSWGSADFNGDGRIDLAASPASILVNNGDGTFAPKADYAALPALDVDGDGQIDSSLAPADFNGDGRIDLAVSSISSESVSVLFNRTAPQQASAIIVSAGHQPVIHTGSSWILSFGKVLTGRQGPVRTLRVTNRGGVTLALGPAKATRGFKVLQGLPKKLKPGQSATIKVRFVGDRAGTWSGRIRFASNDPLHNPFVISLCARRMRPARRSPSR